MPSAKRIDDQDSSVVYSGRDWTTHGGPKEYMGTTSLTRTEGASAKIRFSGSSITVYGTVSSRIVDSSGVTSQYILDGGSPASYTSEPARDTQYSVKFFQSASLSAGEHVLEVINQSKNGWFWLDYFVVTDPDTTNENTTAPISASSQTTTTASSTSSMSPSTILSSTSAAISSITSSTSTSVGLLPQTSTRIINDVSEGASLSHAPSSTPSAMDSSGAAQSSKGPSAGAIVGGVFGGILGLIILIAAIWCIRRKLANKFADEAAAIPSDVPVPSPSVRNFSSSAPNMTQMDNRYGWNAPGVYPFSPGTQGGVKQPYYQAPGPRKPQAGMQPQQAYTHTSVISPSRTDTPVIGLNYAPVSPGHLQSHQRDTSLSARTNSMGVTVTSGPNMMPERPGYGCSTAGRTASTYQPSFDSPPAYPASPPGIPVGAHGRQKQ